MAAADEWRRYEENYKRYGIDLSPEAEQPRHKPEKKPSVKVTARDKGHLLLMVLFAGICGIVMIFMQATASDINYNINSLNEQITTLEAEIDNLNVELNSGGGLDYIEWYASDQLGMVRLTSDQYVEVGGLEGSAEVDNYIAELTVSQKGVAAVVSEKTVSSAARLLLAGAPA